MKKPARRMHATINDVADRAGVSIKTVSRVFNDEDNVRDTTREKVMKAATELDYHPNVAARSLAGRRSFLIGLIHSNPSPNYVTDLHMGALERLRGERYRLIIMPTENIRELSGNVLRLARASGLDGLVLSPPIGDDQRTLDELDAAHFPYVRIAATRMLDHVPDVLMDDHAAAREMMDHLFSLGHRRIGIITGDPDHASSQLRLQGYRDSLEQAGIAYDPALVERGVYTFDSGLAAGRRLLATTNRPSAIFASNDDMAAGVLMAANEKGLKVPQQLSVSGFDDSHIANVVWPRLTTIRQPTVDMARHATDALLALIEGHETSERVILPHELIVRGSTGRAA